MINSGNGAAGPTLDALNEKLMEKGVKTNLFFVNHDPDSTFPNGIPNPLVKENQTSTSEVVIGEKADFGVAFDGDFDRCFFFDQFGEFIPGEYIVSFLAKVFLGKESEAKIIHDTRVIWNTIDMVNKYGGQTVVSKTGHAHVKAAMKTRTRFMAEKCRLITISGFFHCDSGIIPFLLIWEYLSKSSISISNLISERKNLYPSSGELNFAVSNAENCMKRVQDYFASSETMIDEPDGLSMSFDKWRFNLRKSNTEPLVRLNVETRGDMHYLKKKHMN